jgi:hypothetical protein
MTTTKPRMTTNPHTLTGRGHVVLPLAEIQGSQRESG